VYNEGMKLKIPREVHGVAQGLAGAGFQAFLVGGCVRDLLLGRSPRDWDIATNAEPEDVQALFSDSVYENQFGTVRVKTDSKDTSLKVVEVTTFRKEGKYTDKRHPDTITFAKTIEEDLSRRDFTINAMAMDVSGEIVDPCGGQEDLRKKMVRAVGEPGERFSEDALRLVRAVRFAAELGFAVEEGTVEAVGKHAGLLELIAKERIRDEFVKITMSDGAMRGIQLLEDLGLLKFIVSELREGIGCGQNKHHIYTVWEHNMRALDYAAGKGYSLHVRLAALLHDVGKPQTKRGEGKDSTFHGHEVVGAKMATRIMDRLRFSRELSERVIHLVRYHLFYYNVDEVSAAGVRRFLARVGPESVDDLMRVREADRIGSGVPKAVPYKLRHLKFMIDKVKRDPVSPTMLKVSGEDVMKVLSIDPGPKVGHILSVLLDEVLEDPKRNTKKKLEGRVGELGKLSDGELAGLAEKAREGAQEFEGDVEAAMKERHHVK
jgi:tRNA nucleotidyltransferase (CCA-adding enzyme)